MHEITIFTALSWERRAVTAALMGLEPAGLPARWWGRLADGSTCLVVQTGIGPERAAVAARSTPPARVLVGCGCAGGLAPWLRAGDLVIADGVVELGTDTWPGEILGAQVEPLAARAARAGFRAHPGRLVSSPAALVTAGAKEAAAVATGGLVVDMESAALAREAATRGVPFVGLRVVLDCADEALPPELDVVDADTGEVRAGRALAALARRPRLWATAGRLAQQSRRAERQLRRVLAAVLAEEGLGALIEPPAASVAVG